MKRIFGWAALAILTGCGSREQSPDEKHKPPTVTPDEGRRAFEQGLEAVRMEDWTLAIGYFARAQKADPVSPPTLYNLGLAHAKAGNEVAGLAWLRAFLAADPNSANAGAVRAELGRLEEAAKAELSKLFDAALASAEKLPGDGRERRWATRSVAGIRAECGDIDVALSILAKAEPDHEADVPELWKSHAISRLRAGDPQGAIEFLDRIQADGERDGAIREIFEELYARGDLDSARKLAKRSRDGDDLLANLILRTTPKEDFVPLETATVSLSGSARDRILIVLATRKSRIGKIAEARKYAERIQDVADRAEALAEIGLAQLENGDVDSAKATAREILGLGEDAIKKYGMGVWPGVVATAILGNLESAVTMAGKGTNEAEVGSSSWCKAWNFATIAYVQDLSGDSAGSRQTLQLAETLGTRKDVLSADVGLIRLWRKMDPELALQEIGTPLFGNAVFIADQVVRLQIEQGDLAGAERTCRLVLDRPGDAEYPHFGRSYCLQTILALAKAHAARQGRPEALRLLALGVDSALEIEADSVGRDSSYRCHLWEDLIRALIDVSEFQRKLGDAAAADRTGIVAWIVVARFLSAPGVLDWKRGLQELEKSEPNQIPSMVAGLAYESIGDPILRMRGLDRTLAR